MNVIIVAGSANTVLGTLHKKYRRRLDVVVGLMRADPSLKVVVTGGVKKGRGRSPEAVLARNYLLGKGVAAWRILVEDKSASTHSNFTLGMPIAKAAGATGVIVVSDFSHMRRCLAFCYAANRAKRTNLPIRGARWYFDRSAQDASVAQATAQARAAWSGMTTTIVNQLDADWGVVPSHPTLRFGSRGEAVRRLQKLLGVTADGIFGRITENAVKAFQKRHGLVVDGIVGARTWAQLLK